MPRKRPTADEAFIHFCKMGQARSFAALRRWYQENTAKWAVPSDGCLRKWGKQYVWLDRAAEWDVEATNKASARASTMEAEERIEVSMVVENTYRDMLERVRQLLPEVKKPSMIPELVTAAGLLHGQLMEIQRGKLPDQGLLEKIVQQMAGAGNGGDPSDDELQELLELAMAEPGKPLN